MIPKIIHYCWLSDDPIPLKLQKCMKSWKEKLPDYDFMLWDLNRFDVNQSVWVKQAFAVKKYAFAADYIRLYALYKYGGIYLDMDVELLKSFNDLLDFPYFMGYEEANGIEAAVLGFEKESHLVKDCLLYYDKRIFVHDDGVLELTVLPKIMMTVLNSKYAFQSCSLVSDAKVFFRENFNSSIILLFRFDFFSAKSFSSGKILSSTETYSVHHFSGTWLSKRQRLKIFFLQCIGSNNAKILSNIKKQILRKL